LTAKLIFFLPLKTRNINGQLAVINYQLIKRGFDFVTQSREGAKKK